jgi:hypothetical protein
MYNRIFLGAFGMLLTALLAGCEGPRDGKGSPAGPTESVPSEIKVGVNVEFFQPAYPVGIRDGYTRVYEHPQVEEVRANWVRMKWVINEAGKLEQKKGVTYQDSYTYWVNFATVNAYRIVK